MTTKAGPKVSSNVQRELRTRGRITAATSAPASVGMNHAAANAPCGARMLVAASPPRTGAQSMLETIPPIQLEISRAPTDGQRGGWRVEAVSITAGPPASGSHCHRARRGWARSPAQATAPERKRRGASRA
jgi:hypothetical protein